jgi:hypothetical protein
VTVISGFGAAFPQVACRGGSSLGDRVLPLADFFNSVALSPEPSEVLALAVK